MSRTTLLSLLLALAIVTPSCQPEPDAGSGPGSSTGHPATRHHAAQGALGPYSGAVEAGVFLFLSGKIGERGGSFAHEVETAIDAVEAELSRLEAGLGDLVSVTVFLTDMSLYPEFNTIYARRLPAPHPARACVAVAALPGGARVEIQAIGRRKP